MRAAAHGDDKRLIPEFTDKFWTQRKSTRWGYCKYCRQSTPNFILTQGQVGSHDPLEKMRCCWECGSGLEILEG